MPREMTFSRSAHLGHYRKLIRSLQRNSGKLYNNTSNHMERAKESAVWRYFTLTSQTSSRATCNICKGSVARGGSSAAKYNTTNLIKHIQKHHAKDHAKLQQQTEQNKPNKGENMKTQLTLADTLQRRAKLPVDSVKHGEVYSLFIHRRYPIDIACRPIRRLQIFISKAGSVLP